MEILEQILKSKSFEKFNTIMENDKLFHAYLILGEDEFSIKEFSKAIALKLVCSKHKPCLACDNCKKVLANFHPDIFTYPIGKNFVVADSENILANASIRPLESEYKLFIINRVDNATTQSQNKLLKTIEESPKNVIFIFNAVNANNVLQTIKSRTQEIKIENFNQTTLEQEPDFEFLINMLNEMTSSKKTLDFAVKFAEKSGFLVRLETLSRIYEQVLFAKLSGDYSIYSQIANGYEIGAIAEIFELIMNARRRFEANVNPTLITDNLLIKILEVKYLWNKNK